MKQRLLSILAAVSCFCLLLTCSIGLPIYVRPFYYAHIDALNLPARSGFTAEEIRNAYDQVLDYLTIPGKPFSTGVMAHSPSGADHFADCKVLFLLNNGIGLASAAVLCVLWYLRRSKRTLPYRLGNRSSFFWASWTSIAAPVVIGTIAVVDFDQTFVLFHSICFPGKSNWLFDPRTDEIILVLPIEFFANCALLIGSSLLLGALGIIIVSTRRQK